MAGKPRINRRKIVRRAGQDRRKRAAKMVGKNVIVDGNPSNLNSPSPNHSTVRVKLHGVGGVETEFPNRRRGLPNRRGSGKHPAKGRRSKDK